MITALQRSLKPPTGGVLKGAFQTLNLNQPVVLRVGFHSLGGQGPASRAGLAAPVSPPTLQWVAAFTAMKGALRTWLMS